MINRAQITTSKLIRISKKRETASFCTENEREHLYTIYNPSYNEYLFVSNDVKGADNHVVLSHPYKHEERNLFEIQLIHPMSDQEVDEHKDEGQQSVDELTDYGWTNHELCIKLQEDIENYRNDQKEDQRRFEKRSQKKQQQTKPDRFYLKELEFWHKSQAQVVRDWQLRFGANVLMTLSEELEGILEEECDEETEEEEEGEEEETDYEQVVFGMLFDAVMACYDVLKCEQQKILQREYANERSVDLVLLNVKIFWELLNLPQEHKTQKKMKKRVENVALFVRGIVDQIYGAVEKKYGEYLREKEVMKDALYAFIVESVQIVWSVLHHKCCIVGRTDDRDEERVYAYDERRHCKKGGSEGNNVRYYLFPAIVQNEQYVTKIWVMCDE